MKLLRRWRDLFYAGPRDLGVRVRRRGDYQSPTLTAGLWAYALIVRHLTMPGRLVFLCAGVIVPYGMTSIVMPIHLLAFAIGALFALDFIVGFFMCPRLELSRAMPRRIAVGAEGRVDYTVHNTGSYQAWGLWLDSLPLPYTVDFSRGKPFVNDLNPGETHRGSARIRATRRGEYTLPAMRTISSFPFSLWSWGTTEGRPERLLVYPSFHPIDALDLPVGRKYQPGGISMTSKTGESMEFLGCREFREGDNLRHLHMRSWARTGFPVTKEFREEYLCRTALVLDTVVPGDMMNLWGMLNTIPKPGYEGGVMSLWGVLNTPEPAFEGAISLTAGVTDYLASQDYAVDLFAAGQNVYHFEGGRSSEYLDSILDILACLDPSSKETFDTLSPLLLAEIARMSGILFILLRWDDTRKQLVENVASHGVQSRTVLVVDPKRRVPDVPEYVTVISATDIREGRCTRL